MHTPIACCLPLLLALVAGCSSGGSAGGDDPVAITISPAGLPGGTVAAPYVATLFAAGGSGGYQWSIVAGVLPPGVVGIPAGGSSATLSGTPSTAGTNRFTVRVRDAEGNTATAAYQLTVAPGGPGPSGFPTSRINAPSPRGRHTAVWTGSEMIVWGGLDNFVGSLNTGAAYDPIADSWRTLSGIGAPAARFGHTAVWTGTEMIVWGGSNSAGVTGTGGAYDPASDTWRALSNSGAPLRRALHTAVWTGTRMLVYGGQGEFPPPRPNSVDRIFADGGAYDPVTDSWSPIAAGGPATRDHTAVWTGTRMIVWGGRDAFALALTTHNLGGVYDPSANSWIPTTVSGAPVARVGHTAVWSGSEMIVWGGQSDVAPGMSTGGRYSPATDSWSATSLAGAPSARHGHTAVWVGTEMIIWGGASGASLLGTGALYAPATNSWRPMPASFTPTPRADHSAIAAGPQMTLWGGRTDPPVTYVNTGTVLWLFQL